MANIDTFQNRISRINCGKQWVPEGVVHTPVQAAHRKGRHGPVARLFHTISLPMAFSMGLLSMAVARFARLAVSGLPEGGQVMTDTITVDAVLAVVLSFVLAQVVSLRSVAQVMVSALGVGVGALTMHMAVYRAPEVFTPIFGPAWVNAVLSTTDPNMVLYGHLLQRLPV